MTVDRLQRLTRRHAFPPKIAELKAPFHAAA